MTQTLRVSIARTPAIKQANLSSEAMPVR